MALSLVIVLAIKQALRELGYLLIFYSFYIGFLLRDLCSRIMDCFHLMYGITLDKRKKHYLQVKGVEFGIITQNLPTIKIKCYLIENQQVYWLILTFIYNTRAMTQTAYVEVKKLLDRSCLVDVSPTGSVDTENIIKAWWS